MSSMQETIEAVLGSNGQLILAHQPRLPPGPVEVTIRVASPTGGKRALADVIREIAADQRGRGFPGRSATQMREEEEIRESEDADRDRELDAGTARRHRRNPECCTIWTRSSWCTRSKAVPPTSNGR